MTPHRPELPESLTQWPEPAIEFLLCLNRQRRAGGAVGNPNEAAMAATRHARLWWRWSTAHQWPVSGKTAGRLRAGIEPALLTLRRLGARLTRTGEGAAILADVDAETPELLAALAALGLEHLPVKEAGEVAA